MGNTLELVKNSIPLGRLFQLTGGSGDCTSKLQTGKVYASPRVTVIITGASRGFGAALAETFAREYRTQFLEQPEPSSGRIRFVLIARSMDKLKAVGLKLKEVIGSTEHLEVKLIECDFLEPFDEIDLVPEPLLTDTDHYMFVHNAGQLGYSNMLCTDVASGQNTYRVMNFRLNLYSMMELTAGIMKNIAEVTNHITRLDVINISSLAAIKPLVGMLDYCLVKRAREAYIEQLAEEFKDRLFLRGRVRTLNYAPGPLETDMLQEIRDKAYLADQFAKIHALEPMHSAKKLMAILSKNSFVNGQHVDYYDIEDEFNN